jgi:hypothetical protein
LSAGLRAGRRLVRRSRRRLTLGSGANGDPAQRPTASTVVVLLDDNTQPSIPSPALIVDRKGRSGPLRCW